MSVRTWFTLSALVIVALFAAFAFRFFAPIAAPDLIVRADDVRLEGQHVASCWPQRDGGERCLESETSSAEDPPAVRDEGTFRILAAWPAQPEDGEIVVTEGTGDPELVSAWTDELPYDLGTGTYTLRAEARYDDNAYVVYVFTFVIE